MSRNVRWSKYKTTTEPNGDFIQTWSQNGDEEKKTHFFGWENIHILANMEKNYLVFYSSCYAIRIAGI